MGAGFGAFEGWGAIALGAAIGAVGAVSWAIGGIVGGAGIRAVAPGVVGVEGWVGRARGGSMDDKPGNSGSWKSNPKAGIGSGVAEGVIEVSGFAEGAIEVSGVAEGAIEVSGVGDGAIELSGFADTYQDELGEFMRNSECFFERMVESLAVRWIWLLN